MSETQQLTGQDSDHVSRAEFYYRTHRNQIKVDRDIQLEIELAEEFQLPPEAIGDIESDEYRSYQLLCREAIGYGQKIAMFIPEARVSRDMAFYYGGLVEETKGKVNRPDGKDITIITNTALVAIDMGDYNLDHRYGHDFNQVNSEYFVMGLTDASLDVHIIFAEDRSFQFKISPKIAVVNTNVNGKWEYRLVDTESLTTLIDAVLRPLEEDVKSRAYIWEGTPISISKQVERVTEWHS